MAKFDFNAFIKQHIKDASMDSSMQETEENTDILKEAEELLDVLAHQKEIEQVNTETVVNAQNENEPQDADLVTKQIKEDKQANDSTLAETQQDVETPPSDKIPNNSGMQGMLEAIKKVSPNDIRNAAISLYEKIKNEEDFLVKDVYENNLDKWAKKFVKIAALSYITDNDYSKALSSLAEVIAFGVGTAVLTRHLREKKAELGDVEEFISFLEEL